jgi:hypothetical protein
MNSFRLTPEEKAKVVTDCDHLRCLKFSSALPKRFLHVRYGEQKAIIAIDTLTILRGHLAPRVHGLVIEWATLHKEELLEDWALAENQAPLKKIKPLE